MRSLNYALFISILFVGSASAQTEDYTANDVVGMFASEGTIGPHAHTKTVSEAHAICTSQVAGGHEKSDTLDGNAHGSYQSCMADYVPFKLTGQDGADACASATVDWGQCSATLPASPGGAFVSARNTLATEDYEGYGNFQCKEGNWAYVSGGCSRAAHECEDGAVVDWPVTSPIWADESPGTQYVDKFGIPRHTPKGRCYARMPHALSGKLLIARPTVPEMVEPDRYNMAQSHESNRCFDGEWLGEEQNAAVCEYIPKTCSPMTYTHPSGCSYSIPGGAHDEVFSSSTPQPQNSVGSVQAHCWDGTWEIKSSSCQLSCESTITGNTWSSGISGVDRMCAHVSKGYGQRIAPNTNLLIPNETEGMTGSTSYTCVNGTVIKNSESCSPLDCENVSGNSWTGTDGSTCSHNAIPGVYAHGQTISQQVGDLFSETIGEIFYQCQYGELLTTGSSCGLNEAGGDPQCQASEGDPDVEQCLDQGMVYSNGFCCTMSGGDGEGSCVEIDPGEVDPCILNPSAPECGIVEDQCVLNPDAPECGTEEDFCQANPDDPLCAGGSEGGMNCRYDGNNYIEYKNTVFKTYSSEPITREELIYVWGGETVYSELTITGPSQDTHSVNGDSSYLGRGEVKEQKFGEPNSNDTSVVSYTRWEVCPVYTGVECGYTGWVVDRTGQKHWVENPC